MKLFISGIGRLKKKIFSSWTAPLDAGLNLTGVHMKEHARVQKRGL
jgi:hypothetical protein